MKKLSLSLLALTGLVSASIAFAANPVNTKSGYYSTQRPLTTHSASAMALQANFVPPTDITITNASSSMIYVVVPNTPINDVLYTQSQPDHIRNNNGAFNTMIALQDPSHNVFFTNVVCPRALVTVYGSWGSYTVNVDNEYCDLN